MSADDLSERSQNSLLAQRLMEIRQDGISAVLNAERALEAIGRPVQTAIVEKRDRRKRRRGHSYKNAP